MHRVSSARFTIPIRRRICAAAVLVCLAFGIMPSAGLGETAYPLTGKTTVKSILRSGPSTGTKQVQVFSANVEVTILSKSENWYQVQRGTLSGYMREDLLRIVGPGTTTAFVQDAPATGVVSDGSLGMRVLRQGSKGSDVRQLQQILLNWGINPKGVDGMFGACTRDAILLFQSSQGLLADGIAGPGTIAALLSGQAAQPTLPPPTGSVNTSPPSSGTSSRVLRSGSRGEDVRLLQQRLLDLGFFMQTPTGNYLSATVSAVRAFQQACSIQVDGIAGVQTQRLLYSDTAPSASAVLPGAQIPAPTQAPNPTPTPTLPPANAATPAPGTYKLLQKGSTGEAVQQLQQALANLGYYNGNISGTYDTATVTAVKAFQQNNGTGVDGVAGTATQTILYEKTPRPAWEAAPTPAPLAPGVGEMEAPSASQVELSHWFNDVKKNYRAGQTYLVYDPSSKLGWNLRFYSMGNHADSEPLTQQDTDIMFKAFGYVTTWTPKPIYARMPDGRWILATMHNTPHLTGSVRDNGFDGHLCVHFYRDMDEVTKNDPNYGVQNQNALRAAWERMQ